MPSPPTEIEAYRHRLLGMPPAQFLRDYWQKRPLLVRGAFPDFASPLSPDDLAGLACMEDALARIVVHDAKRDRWTLRTGPFDDETFANLPASRWTLLVQDVDKWEADTAALLDHFAFIPRWRIDDVMVSYATDGGGVGAHVDQYDVFLLQGPGRRRWAIDTSPNPPIGCRAGAELKLLMAFSPTHDWVLETGDMLYLPPGVPHEGIAIGECMTYSIGMRAPAAGEMLLDLAEHIAECIPESLRYRDPGLRPSNGDGEIDDAATARVRAALASAGFGMRHQRVPDRQRGRAGGTGDLARIDPAQARVGGTGRFARGAPASTLRMWFGRFITRYRSDFDFDADAAPMPNKAFAHAVDRGAMVEIEPRARAAWQRGQHGATLFVAGRAWACSTRLARRIASRRPFALGEFARSTTDRDVLRALAGCGIIRLQRHREPKR